MKLILCISILYFWTVVNAQVPQFSQSYSTDEVDAIDIHQGQYSQKGNLICCPLKSSGCKVQIEEQAGKTYSDATHNRTRFDPYGSDQSIVTLYEKGKQYVIQNNTCQYYCPLQNDEFGGFGPDPKAKNLGTTTCPGSTSGEQCTNYQWKVQILGIITMEICDFYVTSDGKPWGEVDQITPFGEDIGTEQSTFMNFQAGVPPASLWDDIIGLDNCPKYNNCNNNNDMMTNFLRFKDLNTYAYYRYGSKMGKLSKVPMKLK